jgi:tetratricopeptide (TPR) repeat protein
MAPGKQSSQPAEGAHAGSENIRWWALAVALSTLVLFAPARHFQFINYDDDVFVFANEHVRQGFTWAGVKWAFLAADIDYWRPLSWLSHMLDVELFGLEPGGHHLTSVLIHAVNAALLCLALHALSGRTLPAALIATLFAWHPLHIESVAWVAERKDVLCAGFWFLGLLAYAHYTRAPSKGRLMGVNLCFVLGLMSKPMILTFPFVLLLLDVWPLRRAQFNSHSDWRALAVKLFPLLWEKALLFIMVGLAALGTYLAQQKVGAMMTEAHHPLAARLANLPVAYARYLGLTCWPVDLAILYPLPIAWQPWQVGGALTLLLGITGVGLKRLSREPWLLVGWLWFLGTLVPVIGLVQVGEQAIANRYTYVPLIGLFIALVWCLDGWLAQKPLGRLLGTALSGLALLFCALMTRSELRHWRDSVTIFEQTVRVTRNNFVAMTNLANSLARLGQHARAIELYERSLAVRRDNPTTHYNFAITLAEVGLAQRAEAHYREALRCHPGHAGAHHNLANLLAEQGRSVEALKHYSESLRLQPANLEARFNYAMALSDQGQPEQAITQLELIVRQQPASVRARLQLVTLYGAKGLMDLARQHNSLLLQHEPESVQGQFNAGSLASMQGDWPSALHHWDAAARLKPDFMPALYRLAWTLATHPDARIRDPARAVAVAEHAHRLAGPKNAEFLDVLAAAYAAAGKFDQAVAQARLAMAVAGTNAPAGMEIRARLTLYESGKPFVESVAK